MRKVTEVDAALSRNLFDLVPSPLWREDWTIVARRLEDLRTDGVVEFDTYFEAHPDVAAELGAAIQFLDANQAAVDLYGASSRAEMLEWIRSGRLLTDARAPELLADTLVQFASGRRIFTNQLVTRALDGRRIDVLVNLAFHPGLDERFLALAMAVDVTEHERTARAHRTLVRNSLLGLAIFQHGRVVFANATFAEICGHSVERLLSMSASELDAMLYPEDRDRVNRHAAARIRGEPAPARLEYRIQRPNGAVRWIEEATVRVEHEGQPASQLSVVDITKRKEAEATLRLTQFAVDQAGDAAYWVQPDGNFVYVNDAASRMLGYSREDLTRMSVFDISDGLTPAAWAARWTENAEPTVPTFESKHRRRDGTLVPVEIRANHLEFEDGRQYNCVFARDVTDRKRAEEAFRVTQFAIDHSPAPIYWVHRGGRIVYANEAASRFLGYARDELTSMSVPDIAPGFPVSAWAAHWQEIKTASSLTFEAHHRHRDGRVFPVEITTHFVEHEEQEFTWANVKDLTERKRAEEVQHRLERQLQQTQKLESLGVLAGGIAHDFNNLLTGILGNASLALPTAAPGSQERESLEQIELAARRAAELTNQMLAYSGKGRFRVERVDLSALVKEMGSLLSVSMSRRATVRYELSSSLPAIVVDATQMRQIVLNLLTNASDALDDGGGAIVLRTGMKDADRGYLASSYVDDDLPAGRYVFVEVTDTGAGMDAATQARVFDPFFSTKFTGRGLGLAAVLGIVRGHKGAICVSSAPDHGTVMTVLFPAAGDDAPERLDAEPDMFEAWHGTGTALVVDDDDSVRDVAAAILRAHGLTVLTAADGDEALAMYASRGDEIVFVLLDMTMPGLDGASTLRALREAGATVPVVLMSGFAEQEAARGVAHREITEFLQKPFRADALIEVVAKALDDN